MKIYLCSCSYCTWQGNKIHPDGQCPVCGHGLDIGIRSRRASGDLSSKLRISGLPTDHRVEIVAAAFSLIGRWIKAHRG